MFCWKGRRTSIQGHHESPPYEHQQPLPVVTPGHSSLTSAQFQGPPRPPGMEDLPIMDYALLRLAQMRQEGAAGTFNPPPGYQPIQIRSNASLEGMSSRELSMERQRMATELENILSWTTSTPAQPPQPSVLAAALATSEAFLKPRSGVPEGIQDNNKDQVTAISQHMQPGETTMTRQHRIFVISASESETETESSTGYHEPLDYASMRKEMETNMDIYAEKMKKQLRTAEQAQKSSRADCPAQQAQPAQDNQDISPVSINSMRLQSARRQEIQAGANRYTDISGAWPIVRQENQGDQLPVDLSGYKITRFRMPEGDDFFVVTPVTSAAIERKNLVPDRERVMEPTPPGSRYESQRMAPIKPRRVFHHLRRHQ